MKSAWYVYKPSMMGLHNLVSSHLVAYVVCSVGRSNHDDVTIPCLCVVNKTLKGFATFLIYC